MRLHIYSFTTSILTTALSDNYNRKMKKSEHRHRNGKRITFDPGRKGILLSRWRKEKLPPYDVLRSMGIRNTDVVADIGCGPGFFTIPASEFVDTGPVYAMDLSEEMLKALHDKNPSDKIITVITGHYDLKIPAKTVTFSILSSVIHEIEDTEKFIREIHRITADGGRLAVIEWHKAELDLGPSIDHKFSPDEVISLFKKYFSHIKTISFNEYYYGCLLMKL